MTRLAIFSLLKFKMPLSVNFKPLTAICPVLSFQDKISKSLPASRMTLELLTSFGSKNL